MEPLLEYLAAHPSVGLYAVIGGLAWKLSQWKAQAEARIARLEERLADHEGECAVRVARLHERIDQLLERVAEKASHRPLTDLSTSGQG